MFTFHKPRVYRSTEGCCICRAKSSSSRFTDSKKYENDSIKCFDLKQARYGEICNACVLLVKRYKRLPVGSNRHWGHVVDARAGPGTKSLTKYKRQRDELAEFNGAGGNNSHATYNGKSLIGEKFSKIYKKNKKLKSNLSTSPSCNSKRKSANSSSSHAWDNPNHHQNQQSLPSTPDSLDSDYEDTHLGTHSGTVVEFQTQTRASAYRSLNRKSLYAAGCVNSSSVHRRHAVGSLRRKCAPPRKINRAIIENNVQFFDENEWQKRQSCCGPVYECQALGGALIFDLEFYKPCAEHQKKSIKKELQPTQIHNLQTVTASYPQHYQQQQQQQQLQKTIIATMSTVATTKPTQVLKKHHLFFKRQSECFPHTDLSTLNTANNQVITSLSSAKTTSAPATKTDLPISVITCTTGTAVAAAGTKTLSSLKTSADLTTTTNLSISTSALNTTNIISTPITSRHSMAKISLTPSTTTIAGNNNSNININTNNKSTNFLHKIKATKADTGKISKHSLEKISAAVRIMPGDLNDMRHMIKTVDKSYLLNKHQQTVVAPPPVSHHHHISIVGATLQGTIINTAKLSPTCTSSLAPKFSDNSSDSGFDENLQDRKSASPLHEDNEIKMLTRPSIPNGKKIFSTAGVNSYCPAQSMLLQPGIEEAMKLRQQYRQHTTVPPMSSHQRNNRTSSVKIAHIVGGNNHNIIQHNSGASQKMHMRAIYNNNTIKHENGVTTIVPASSLAASSQTAAMSALVAPNTVTITPSPSPAAAAATATSIHNHTSGIKVGLGSMSGGGVGGAPTTATHLTAINNNNLPNLNQKIIFLKTAKHGNNNHNNNTNSNNTTSIANSLHHLTNNNYHSTTMMNTTTTAATTTTIPKPPSMKQLQQQQQVSATTLGNVLNGQQQSLCVKIDCNS